jgi:hypothetical protein
VVLGGRACPRVCVCVVARLGRGEGVVPIASQKTGTEPADHHAAAVWLLLAGLSVTMMGRGACACRRAAAFIYRDKISHTHDSRSPMLMPSWSRRGGLLAPNGCAPSMAAPWGSNLPLCCVVQGLAPEQMKLMEEDIKGVRIPRGDQRIVFQHTADPYFFCAVWEKHSAGTLSSSAS